jgi:hypothetical protein
LGKRPISKLGREITILEVSLLKPKLFTYLV